MIRKPWFVFDNVTDTWVDKIPVNSNIQITDDSALADGSGSVYLINVHDITGLGGATKIEDLLALPLQWTAITTPHGFIAEDTGATFEPNVTKTDFFEYSITQTSNIQPMLNAKPGDTGTIVIHKNPSTVLTWDASYDFPLGLPIIDKVTNIFEYKALNIGTSQKITMDFVQDDEYSVMFTFTGTFPTITGTFETSTDGITYATGGADPFVRSNDITHIQFAADTTSVSLANIDNILDFSNMFNGCTLLTDIDTSNVDFSPGSGAITTDNMFNGCTALTCHGNIDTSSAASTATMYTGCGVLTSPNATDQASIEAGKNWTSPGCP